MEAFNITGNWLTSAAIYIGSVIVLGVLIAYRAQLLKFLGEVRVELAKCSWPWNPELTGFRRYKELYDSTVVVSITTLLLAGYVASFDFFIKHIVELLINF